MFWCSWYSEFSLFCREFSLFYREFSLFCREFSLFCRHFLYSAVGFLYFAVTFFVLPWDFFILLWLCLCCRDFNYIAVVLFFLPWQLWATVRSSYRKCSIKKADLNILNIHRKRPMLESRFNKVQGWRSATLLKKDSKIGVFWWISLFTNDFRITCFSFCVDIFSKKDY